MRILILTSVIFFMSFSASAQFNVDVSGIYFQRATKGYLSENLEQAQIYFNKGVKYDSVINESSTARIGTLINYELQDFMSAQVYAKRYFELKKYSRSREYREMKKLYALINKSCKEIKLKEDRQKLKKLTFQREQRELDSLNQLWTSISQKFYVTIDSVGSFNKFNIAVYKLNGNLGLIDHSGNVIVKADTYAHAIEYDGYVVFMDDAIAPKKLYCYNAHKQESYALPDINQFNDRASDFGKVMLPRQNGILVTYPNKKSDVIVFDLNKREQLIMKDKKSTLKKLSKNGVIENFNEKLEVKIDNEWYAIKTPIGADIYPLYKSNNVLYGFFSASSGRVYKQEYYNYFGSFCDGKFQIVENGITYWMTADGLKIDDNINQSGTYTGTMEFVQTGDNRFLIMDKQNGQEVMVMGNEKLVLFNEFVKNRS